MIIKNALKNWKTTILGVILFVALVLWGSKVIDTTDFIAVAGFLSSVGFFVAKDSDKVGKVS